MLKFWDINDSHPDALRKNWKNWMEELESQSDIIMGDAVQIELKGMFPLPLI